MTRVWGGVEKKGPDECWPWKRGFDGPLGKGQAITWFHGGQRKVSRLIYAEIHGEIPEGMLVRYRCKDSGCCNPSHLFLQTKEDFYNSAEQSDGLRAYFGDPVERFWRVVNKNGPIPARYPELGPCWVWTACLNNHGYGKVGRGHKYFIAHRLAWIYAIGAIPDKLCVLHRCDNPPCVNPKHLFLGTHQDNMDDCVSKGRTKKAKLQ
jgi:hypothetical protein